MKMSPARPRRPPDPEPGLTAAAAGSAGLTERLLVSEQRKRVSCFMPGSESPVGHYPYVASHAARKIRSIFGTKLIVRSSVQDNMVAHGRSADSIPIPAPHKNKHSSNMRWLTSVAVHLQDSSLPRLPDMYKHSLTLTTDASVSSCALYASMH